MKQKIKRLIDKRVVVLDGAIGTELQKRGMPASVCPERWCLDNSHVLSSVYSDYKKAGADIVYTSTFGANRIKFSQYKIKDVVSVNKELAYLARRAAGPKVLVAGDIGPTGKFIKPFGALRFDEAVDIFKEQVKGLILGGVDLFVIETMMDIQEARAALIAVKEVTDKFIIVTMTYEKNGRTLNGNGPISVLITLQSLGADAVGCNCSSGPEDMFKIISLMKPYAKVPLVAKPNAGIPKLIGNKSFFDMSTKEFGRLSKKLIDCGVNLIGGCCGTTPEYISSLKRVIKNIRPHKPVRTSISAISSARGYVVLNKVKKIVIIGEKINPTGKKKLQEELLKGKLSLVRQLAKEQEISGAKLLDVNVGLAGIDESKTMLGAISLLSTASNLPLVIDSANPEVIEKVLRLYPGRAMINSISGEKEKLKKLLPLAKKYGAMFILLPLVDKKIPMSFNERKKIIISLFKRAKKEGFIKDDIVVDALAMAVSSNPNAAFTALETIKWCSNVFKCSSVVGLSNISFGMPKRRLINRVFIGLAGAHGLTLAIADSAHNRILKNKLTQDLLFNKEKAGIKFISKYSALGPAKVKKQNKKHALSHEDRIFKAILDANKEDISALVREAVFSKIVPSKLMQKVLIPAIIEVGSLFQAKKYFLPQLIASAETMEKAVMALEPFLKKSERRKAKKGIIVMTTVKGDIHDIGKNIVILMLKNHGFEIIDAGKDVTAQKIIGLAKRSKADMVGLSALMTTTMVNMKEVVNLAKKKGLKCKFMVGGAVLNKSYALSIGAEYAKDGVSAVRIAEQLVKK